jgi:hypothetical protein
MTRQTTARRIAAAALLAVGCGACTAPVLVDPARPVDVPQCRWSPPHLCESDQAVRVWLADGTTFTTDLHTARGLVRSGQVSGFEPIPQEVSR